VITAFWCAPSDARRNSTLRSIERYKDKHWRRGKLRRQGGQIVEALPELAAPSLADTQEEEERPRIVRTKEFQVKPMYSDEAVEQMELLGHNFFIFQDADTGWQLWSDRARSQQLIART
jgi:hypothetical protein